MLVTSRTNTRGYETTGRPTSNVRTARGALHVLVSQFHMQGSLLAQIQGGAKLRKAVTADKSAPAIVNPRPTGERGVVTSAGDEMQTAQLSNRESGQRRGVENDGAAPPTADTLPPSDPSKHQNVANITPGFEQDDDSSTPLPTLTNMAARPVRYSDDDEDSLPEDESDDETPAELEHSSSAHSERRAAREEGVEPSAHDEADDDSLPEDESDDETSEQLEQFAVASARTDGVEDLAHNDVGLEENSLPEDEPDDEDEQGHAFDDAPAEDMRSSTAVGFSPASALDPLAAASTQSPASVPVTGTLPITATVAFVAESVGAPDDQYVDVTHSYDVVIKLDVIGTYVHLKLLGRDDVDNGLTLSVGVPNPTVEPPLTHGRHGAPTVIAKCQVTVAGVRVRLRMPQVDATSTRSASAQADGDQSHAAAADAIGVSQQCIVVSAILHVIESGVVVRLLLPEESTRIEELESDAAPSLDAAPSVADEPVWTSVEAINDVDGDGVPDYAHPLMLMVDADGDGVSDGLHADKLGLFLPQPQLCNDRPFFTRDDGGQYSLWWAAGRWWLGPEGLLGHKKGWLKSGRASSQSGELMPPTDGWMVYSKPEAAWQQMEGMVAIPACSPPTDGPRVSYALGLPLAGTSSAGSVTQSHAASIAEGYHDADMQNRHAASEFVGALMESTRESMHPSQSDEDALQQPSARDCLEQSWKGGSHAAQLQQALPPTAANDKPSQASQASEKAADEPVWTSVEAINDVDGDGVPDYAHPLMLMVDADGDGVSDGLHADKLGLFLPQPQLCNDRPFFTRDDGGQYSLWWAAGRWWLGPEGLLGHKKGWLKSGRASSQSGELMPPTDGWMVYSKPEAAWQQMEGMVALPWPRGWCSESVLDTGWTPDLPSPPKPKVTPPTGIPITPRAVKSSMQLRRELQNVGKSLDCMGRRVEQSLAVVRGTCGELKATLVSVRQRLQANPSLTEDPRCSKAMDAAAAAVSEEMVESKLSRRFERKPLYSELAVELKLEVSI